MALKTGLISSQQRNVIKTQNARNEPGSSSATPAAVHRQASRQIAEQFGVGVAAFMND
jgi:hypothetical protein